MKTYLQPTASSDSVESLYIDNLRYVMDEVAHLVNDLEDKEVILTADHGESLGEGFIMGHPPGVRHSAVRDVPWARIE